MEYLLIFISAIFVNNIILSQFLGICPFLGVSRKIDTALGMGAAVAFVLTLATIVTYLVQKCVLDPFGLQYLQTLAFILVIAALVQMVEIILKKVSPSLEHRLCLQHRHRLRRGVDSVCRHTRATVFDTHTQGHAGHGHRVGDRGTVEPCLHGLLWR